MNIIAAKNKRQGGGNGVEVFVICSEGGGIKLCILLQVESSGINHVNFKSKLHGVCFVFD